MKLAILTCGMLPIPAVQGGAVENLIDFYLEYNDLHRLHDITVYSQARIGRKLYGYFHSHEYYNYFIEYYFEEVYSCLKKRDFDYIILENCPGYAYKLSQRGFHNLVLHLHNELLHSNSRYHDIIFNSLTKILTVSDYIKARVASIQHSNKIQTVHNGIDLAKFTPKKKLSVSREYIGFSEEDFILVYNGRIINEKGISELIDAMLQIRDTRIKLIILGSSFFENVKDEDTFVQSLRRKATKIEKQIVFTGFIPYSQVPDYLQLADIAVLPSMWEEPFGLTIVEAMATGLPLITTRSGGIPEICEGVATIVDRNNIINNLVSAILNLYNHPDKRKQMAAASRERAKLFNKETFAKNFFNAIEDI